MRISSVAWGAWAIATLVATVLLADEPAAKTLAAKAKTKAAPAKRAAAPRKRAAKKSG